ncbi:DUF6515 family protein [Aquabacterium sp.]|uniref:DUF6515 family protein n=1 Tax=Aquabacterium sp. TaxID=1872578 RepID=UPI003782DE83
MRRFASFAATALAAATLATLPPALQAAPGEGRDAPPAGAPRAAGPGPHEGRAPGPGLPEGRAPGPGPQEGRAPAPGVREGRAPVPGAPHRGEPPRWWDGAHGHGHYYPTPGWAVRTLPPHSHTVVWAGVNYGFYDGVWYAPGLHGYTVVRPPYGIIVDDLPLFRTMVVIGGLTYLYANGVYYRERVEGGYEVVPTPVDGRPAPVSGPANDKLYVYPRNGQSAQQQSTDEYECHRWATSQTGFDPTAAAVGQPSGDASRRGDYQRARTACLEGRGYTVR